MKFEILPAHDLALKEQAQIFNRAFAGYLAGWTDIDAAGLARLICAQGIDICHSRFVRADGAITGFGYINRTGNVSRLAGMGVVPEARRTGAAASLLSQLLNEARSRTDAAMVLECFEQNLSGLALYRRNGFCELTRLFGWRRVAQNVEMPIEGRLDEISLLAASQIRSSKEFPEIPWQISCHAVAKLAGAHAYQLDNACTVITNPDVTPIRIHAVPGYDGANETSGRSVLAAVLRKFPESEFFAREIFPEEFGPKVFKPLGFKREPLNQILMRHDLKL